MTRFLYSSTALKDYATCPAKFHLWQTGAEREPMSANLLFGVAFHRFMELYVNHCILENRHSDIEVIPELLATACTETSIPTDRYVELRTIIGAFCGAYRIDAEHSIEREAGLAFDADLNPVPWDDALEYERLSSPAEQKGDVVVRAKLDDVALNPETRVLTVRDYKSDIFLPSQSRVNDLSSRFYRQGRLYAWAAWRGIFPAQIVDVEFLFARHVYAGAVATRYLSFTADDCAETEKMLREEIGIIESRSRFEARPGEHCTMCPFRLSACPMRGTVASLETPVERMRRLLFLAVEHEDLRARVKEDVAEFGFDGELGDLRASFSPTEENVPDMEKVWDVLQSWGISEPWRVLNLSKTDAKRILDRDAYEDLIREAYSQTTAVKFSVHQKKDALVALCEARGIDTTKKTVAQLAFSLATWSEAAPEVTGFEVVQDMTDGAA